MGIRRGEVGDAEHVEGVGDVAAVTARVDEVGEEPAGALTFGGDAQVVLDGEVVEQLQRLPGPAEPEAGLDDAGPATRCRGRRSGSARRRDEPGEPIDERRLAGPVGTDQPDDLPFGDVEVDAVDGARPPNVTDTAWVSSSASLGSPVSGTAGAPPEL